MFYFFIKVGMSSHRPDNEGEVREASLERQQTSSADETFQLSVRYKTKRTMKVVVLTVVIGIVCCVTAVGLSFLRK